MKIHIACPKLKTILLMIVTTMLLVSCSGVRVRVSNPLKIARLNETVEISWDDIVAVVPEITPVNVVVTSGGDQQPSQVLYKGGVEPRALIFQATVSAYGNETYTIKVGVRETYPAQAYGRFIPEHKDDFAWENNLIAYRMYGPAMEAGGALSNGIDVWLKRTDRLIIDKWYAPGFNRHVDSGEGLDCYKVGRTLGAGAMAPYEKELLWLGRNFTTHKLLDSGPIRISFQLDYAPFRVDTFRVTERRTISLDANTHFNRITEVYTGGFDRLKVAAGVTLRGAGGKVLDILNKPIRMVGYWEPENGQNGNTGIGIVFPCEMKVETRFSHLLNSTTIKQGEPFTYLAGAGWSKSTALTSAIWTQMIFKQNTLFRNPLIVTIK